eukprot:jgi/Ulvmu1/7405/UM036_0065.1
MLLRLGLFGVVGAVGVLVQQKRVANCRQTTEHRSSTSGGAGPSSGGTPAPAADASPLGELWNAALRGEATTVRRLLQRHSIAPDTPHHVTGAPLVVEIANVLTVSEHLDSSLKKVLVVLARAGWNLRVQLRVSQENALHRLATQNWRHQIYHRVQFLLDAELADPIAENLLAMKDSDGLLPEEAAAVDRTDMVPLLHVTRLQIRHAIERRGARRGNGLGLVQAVQGAWLWLGGGANGGGGGGGGAAAAGDAAGGGGGGGGAAAVGGAAGGGGGGGGGDAAGGGAGLQN